MTSERPRRASTTRIDGLLEVEHSIGRQVRAEMERVPDDALLGLVFFALLALLSVLGAIVIAIFINRGISERRELAARTIQIDRMIAGAEQELRFELSYATHAGCGR